MKLIFTLLFLSGMVSNDGNGQSNDLMPKSKSIDPVDLPKPGDTEIFFTCGACRSKTVTANPMLVIDGVPCDFDELKKIDPNDITSIDILKQPAESKIYCGHRSAGVIIITTKSAAVKTFVVKDVLKGNKIPGATVRFAYNTDTINSIADENGIVVTNKLKPRVPYNITVSSVGYKTFSGTINYTRKQEVLLEKDIKQCSEIVIPCTDWFRRTRCGFSVVFIRESPNKNSIHEPGKPIYPNPVLRNSSFNLEWKSEQNETIQLSVASMSGSLVFLQTQNLDAGAHHFSIAANAKWSAGIYIVRVTKGNGSIIKQEKLIVQ